MSGGLQRAGSALSSMSTTSDSLMEKQLNELISDKDLDGPAASNQQDGQENVAVMVRCRPLLVRKKFPNDGSAVEINEENRCIQVLDRAARAQSAISKSEAPQATREFYFDRVFSVESNNESVYMQSARRLVEAAFNGYNCTIFLYGQTGTGKTYTHSSLTSSAFDHLFSLIQSSNQEAHFLIRASYYELYNEEIHDLLAKQPLRRALDLRESNSRGVYIQDLTCFLVNNPSELEKLKQLGDKKRATAATKMNEHSSRSHSIFSITIETVSAGPPKSGGQRKSSSKSNTKQQETVRLGRLNLIDLAGSERQTKSGSSGARLKEASRINLSLTCLSLVIRALTDSQSSHVPYRNSKLTRLLSSSLGGNSKTLLIACIAPELSNLDETLNTLRFASRTKRIKNTAKINEDPKDALLRKYRQQVEELRRKLREQREVATASGAQTSIEAPIGLAIKDSVDDNKDDQATRQQLELLKSKIMFGGENLLDKVELHERLLEASQAELEEKRRHEKRLREQLEVKRNRLEFVKQSKGSLQSQRQQLEPRLKRAILLYKKSKLEQRDQVSEHEQLKESLLQGIKATSKEIKFVDCIIEDFIPREYLDLINAYAQYDDESDEWQIKHVAMSGNNIAQTTRRPLTGGLAANNVTQSSSTPSSAATLSSVNEGKSPSNQSKSARNFGRKPERLKSSVVFSNHRPDPYIRLQS